MNEEKKQIKVPLEGGMFRGVVVLDGMCDNLIIRVQHGIFITEEMYEIRHINKDISLFKDGNAKLSMTKTSTTPAKDVPRGI